MSNAIARAMPYIEASMQRSPCGHTLEEVMAEVLGNRAQLWLGDQSAAVSQFVRTARITNDERIWHAGGEMRDLIETLKIGADAAREVGCDRLVIEDTRAGWAKVLRPYGFKPIRNVLECEL